MTKKTEAPAKRKGRPAGSKTKDRAVVSKVIVLDQCPRCGCTKEPTNKRLRREGAASGIVAGRQYGYYRMFTANCAECKRAFVLKEYDAVNTGG